MPEFKEKTKAGKPKEQHGATLTMKRATRLMKEKYRQQLEQRAEQTGSESTYATDKVESIERGIAEVVYPHVMSRSHRGKSAPMTERPIEGQTIPTAASHSTAHHPKPQHIKSTVPKQEQKKADSFFKSRPPTAVKTKERFQFKVAPSSKRGTPPVMAGAAKSAQNTAQQRMARKAMAQTQKAAKTAATVTKKMGEAAVRAASAMVSSLVGLLGGAVLLSVLAVVVVIAAIASSPFGLFFAAERTAPNTLSVSEAVAQIRMEYNEELERLQEGDYDYVELHGQPANWPDVLAVFAARYAAAENGVDVATLDADRMSKLTFVFWDMTDISSHEEIIDHPDSDPDDEVDDSWTECILHITVTAKSAEDMKTAYFFTEGQTIALDELLSDRAALESLVSP